MRALFIHERLKVMTSSTFDDERSARVAAWLDTEQRIAHWPLPQLASPVTTVLTRPARCTIEVKRMDTLDCAALYSANRKVGVHCMGSARHPCGGVRWGAAAQEEELCRRTDLAPALKAAAAHYPIHHKVLVHKGVSCFKKGAPSYARVRRANQLRLTFFTSPAVKLRVKDPQPPSEPTGPTYEEMSDRIDRLVSAVERSGVEVMVFGAWGCGAFNLEAELVAKLFLQRLRATSLPHAVFAVLNDRNGPHNFDAFRRILCA